MTNVAINGMGRIGRAALKILLDLPEWRLVAVNDLVPVDNLVYLLRYDSVYGREARRIEAAQEAIVIEGRQIPVFHESGPEKLPWGDLEVDVVFECTGVFRTRTDMEKHLQAGAKQVVLSAPAKSEDVPTLVVGANRLEGQPALVSAASCTTNCIAPVVEVLDRRIGLDKAVMTTIHAYTSSQQVVDGPKKDFRRGRAAAANFVPASTGAAEATAKCLPQFANRFSGVAVRAPVICGSIADVVCVTRRDTSVQEVNDVFRQEAATPRYEGILGASDEPLVSTDILGDSRASIVDLSETIVVGGNLVKVMSWYDNEWGYAAQMVRCAMEIRGKNP